MGTAISLETNVSEGEGVKDARWSGMCAPMNLDPSKRSSPFLTSAISPRAETVEVEINIQDDIGEIKAWLVAETRVSSKSLVQASLTVRSPCCIAEAQSLSGDHSGSYIQLVRARSAE